MYFTARRKYKEVRGQIYSKNATIVRGDTTFQSINGSVRSDMKDIKKNDGVQTKIMNKLVWSFPENLGVDEFNGGDESFGAWSSLNA